MRLGTSKSLKGASKQKSSGKPEPLRENTRREPAPPIKKDYPRRAVPAEVHSGTGQQNLASYKRLGVYGALFLEECFKNF